MDATPESAAEAAFTEWIVALGAANLLQGKAAMRYRAGTTATDVRILGALLPKGRDQVVKLVRIAQAHRIPLYPISKGKNWGYGDARPVRNDNVIVDLSRMNRIIALDPDLGVVTLEPGVTQHELHRYLEQRGLEYLVPVTGAGPDASIIGNALERGYGITPEADHFQALTCIEAVLPNGSVYRSAMTGMGAETADQVFKWGLGPYVDGIFSQGAFGIVTQASVALAKKPDVMEAFYFRLNSDELLEIYTRCVRHLLVELGSLTGGINLMSAHRMLAMLIPNPQAPDDTVLSAEQLRTLMKENGIPSWFGAGSLYGSKIMIRSAKHIVRKTLAPVAKRISFVNRPEANDLLRLTRNLPSALIGQHRRRLQRACAHLGIIEGEPSEFALPLAYWRSDVPKPESNLDPARDGCGLLWYAPLVPMKGHTVRDAIAMIRRVSSAYQIEPMMTLTSLSSRCFDLTVPIVFSQKDDSQSDRARRCLERMFAEGQHIGVVPYRVGTESMTLVASRSPYWRLVSELKAAVDPHGIVAPGRYST